MLDAGSRRASLGWTARAAVADGRPSPRGHILRLAGIDSMACTASAGSVRSRLARSCFMCSALEVPVSGRIPILRAKLNTIWAGVALAFAAETRIRGWCSTS